MLGPGQEVVIDANKIGVETHNTIDLGTNAARFKSAYFQGTVTSVAFAGPLTGTITGDVVGNADTATALETARTIAISGQITGTATSFDGTGNIAIPVGTLSATNLNAGTIHSDRVSGAYTGITGTGALDAGSITSGFGNINIGSDVFTGVGSGITALNASNISTGTISAARLPNISASTITSGTLANERLPSAISVSTVEASSNMTGNLIHNTGGGYLRLGSYDTSLYGSGSARIWYNHNDEEIILLSQSGGATVVAETFSGSGSGLTSLSASQLSTGTIPSGRVSGSYTGITGVGTLSTGSISAGFGDINIGSDIFSGNGSGLTNLDADEISSGNLGAARLPAEGSTASNWVTGNMALASAGETGTFGLFLGPANGHTGGNTYSGSDLRTPHFAVDINDLDLTISFTSGPSGTWRAMDTNDGAGADERTLGLFLRIS